MKQCSNTGQDISQPSLLMKSQLYRKTYFSKILTIGHVFIINIKNKPTKGMNIRLNTKMKLPCYFNIYTITLFILLQYYYYST